MANKVEIFYRKKIELLKRLTPCASATDVTTCDIHNNVIGNKTQNVYLTKQKSYTSCLVIHPSIGIYPNILNINNNDFLFLSFIISYSITAYIDNYSFE